MIRHGVDLQIAFDPDHQAELASKYVFDAVKKHKGPFLLALSGGSTPRRFHQRLAEVDREVFPWRQLQVFFSDERAVPPDHPESNHRMARETLLDAVPVGLDRIHRIVAEHGDLTRVAEEYEAKIGELTGGSFALDLIVLGMGGDGHTASLFPGMPAPVGRYVSAVEAPASTAASGRISFTYELLAKAKRLLVLVSGSEKAERLKQVLWEDGELPMQRMVGSRKEGTTFIVDKAAAKIIEAAGRLE